VSSESDHLALADRNQGAIAFLLTEADNHPDWIATIAFYKAIHLIEALFHRFSTVKHGGNHSNREQILKAWRDPRYDDIYKHLMALKQASCVARYLSVQGGGRGAYTKFEDYMTADGVQKDILGTRLHLLEKAARNMLAPKKKKKRKTPPKKKKKGI